jgi:excisionase family DNA binding protein
MTERQLTARERLAGLLAPDVLAALDELVSERVAEVVATMTDGGGSPWLGLDEAAEYLRVSPRTLERLIAKQRIRSTTLGRRRLLHRDDLDALVNGDGGGEARTAPPRRQGVE